MRTILAITMLAVLLPAAARADDVVAGGRVPCPACVPCPAPCPPLAPAPSTAPSEQRPDTSQGRTPSSTEQPTSSQTDTSSQAQAGEAGTAASSSFVSNMFGDLIGASGVRTVFRPVTTVTANGRSFTRLAPVQVRVPLIASASSFKITENESPRPVDRVFINYNYYNDVDRAINQPFGPNYDVHNETVGFEKTFLDGEASFGMRLPLVQIGGDRDVSASDFGSLSLIFKYAVYDDTTTGNLISTGMVLTLPTGPSFGLPGASDLNPTLLQPYVGYIWKQDEWFLQGFSALIVPTDARDVTLLTNDVAVGYLFRLSNGSQGSLNGIAPTVEFHVNTPLSHRGADNFPVGFPDTFDITVGSRFFFGKGSSLGVAVCVPLTGPRIDQYEGLAQLNVRF
jgi:hypothetical protein